MCISVGGHKSDEVAHVIYIITVFSAFLYSERRRVEHADLQPEHQLQQRPRRLSVGSPRPRGNDRCGGRPLGLQVLAELPWHCAAADRGRPGEPEANFGPVLCGVGVMQARANTCPHCRSWPLGHALQRCQRADRNDPWCVDSNKRCPSSLLLTIITTWKEA